MIASDKTKEVELQRILELDKQEVQFIKTCIENPLDFIDLSNDVMEIVDDIYFMDDYHLFQETIFRNFHTLKGRFGQFRQDKIINGISSVEDVLENKQFNILKETVKKFDDLFKDLIKKHRTMFEACNKLIQDDGAAIGLMDLYKKLDYIKSIDELKDFLHQRYVLQDVKDLFHKFSYIIKNTSNQQGKTVEYIIEGDVVKVDKMKYNNFLNVCVHLFRNMVDHGIEFEEDRIEKQKPIKGYIKVELKERGDFFDILIQDDGQGIDSQKLVKKALANSLKTEEEIKKEDPLDLIFIHGLSTKEEVTDASGRGVGMGAVKEEISNLKGSISVSSFTDEGTTFLIRLPIIK